MISLILMLKILPLCVLLYNYIQFFLHSLHLQTTSTNRYKTGPFQRSIKYRYRWSMCHCFKFNMSYIVHVIKPSTKVPPRRYCINLLCCTDIATSARSLSSYLQTFTECEPPKISISGSVLKFFLPERAEHW